VIKAIFPLRSPPPRKRSETYVRLISHDLIPFPCVQNCEMVATTIITG